MGGQLVGGGHRHVGQQRLRPDADRLVQRVLAGDPQLVLEVDVAGGDEQVQVGPLGDAVSLWCRRARRRVRCGDLGCVEVVAASTWVCFLAESPPGDAAANPSRPARRRPAPGRRAVAWVAGLNLLWALLRRRGRAGRA